MKAVSDSTPLIHLSKIGSVNLLKKVFKEIIIPKSIYEEILEGKKYGKNEILSLEKLINEKFILIKEPASILQIDGLDKGEIECISLCKESNIQNILIDEKKGTDIANLFNLNPIRTTTLLLILLDKKTINFEEYQEILKKLLSGGYFLDAQTYEKLISIGKNISEK